MFQKKFIASLSIIAIISNIFLSSASYAFSTTEDLLENIETIQKNKGSFPANLHFKADSQYTSASCLYYTAKEDKVHFLLGYRDDQDSWCNLGGKSDAEDEGLHHTAFREGTEESMHFFSMHPDLLKRLPFVDLLTLQSESGKEDAKNQTFSPLLHRMYFVPVEGIDEKVINDRLTEGDSLGLKKHNQEYRKFKWVSGDKVLQAVQEDSLVFDEEASEEKNEKGKEQRLFKPLYQALSTPTGLNLLKTLVQNKKLPSLQTSQLRSNELHLAGMGRGQDPAPNISWQTIHIGEEQAKEIAEAHKGYWREKRKEKAEHKIMPPQISMKTDAFGETESKRRIGTFFEESVHQDPEFNRRILGQAVATKALAGLELKERIHDFNSSERLVKRLKSLQDLELGRVQKENESLSQKERRTREQAIQSQYASVVHTKEEEGAQEQTLWNPSLTMSEMLLRVQLGEDYQEPTDSNHPEKRKEANVVNLKNYYQKFGANEGELRRKVDKYLDSDFERLADLMEIEYQHKSFLPMYHGSEPKIKYFWQVSTTLRRFLSLQNPHPHTLPGLRATDIYFKEHSTMEESLKKAGTGDYDHGNANRRFCANMALTAGLQTTHTSSNSLEYFLNAHSVQSPAAMKRLEEAANLLGISQISYAPYQALFEQYHENMESGLTNSSMILMLVHPSIINQYAYLARGGGDLHLTLQQKHLTMLEAYLESQKEMGRKIASSKEKVALTNKEGNNPTGQSSLISEKRVENIAEVRFLLHPDIMFDPNLVRVHSTSRYKLLPHREGRASQLLNWTLSYDLGNWLSAHTAMMPDSYTGVPALKTLYRYVYEGETGDAIQEKKSTAKAFPHLVKNGHFEGVKFFYEQFPKLVDELGITPKKLILMSRDSGHVDLMRYVLDEIVHCDDLSKFFSKGEILFFLAKDLDNLKEGNIELAKYLLSKIKETFLGEEEKVKLTHSLFTRHLYNPNFGVIAKFVHENFYPINESFLRKHYKGLKIQERGTFLCYVMRITHLPIETVFGLLFDILEEREADVSSQAIQLLKERPGFDFTVLSQSGDPFLFRLATLTYLDQEIIAKIEHVKNLLDVRNQEGLTLLQYMQKGWLSGTLNRRALHWPMLSIIQSRMESEKRDYLKESYPPFIQEVGDMRAYNLYRADFPRHNFSGDSKFEQWRKSFLEAIQSDHLEEIIQRFNEAPRDYALYYAAKHPAHYSDQQNSLSYPQRVALYNSLQSALESGEGSQVEKVKSSLPLGMLSDWDGQWLGLKSDRRFSEALKDLEEKRLQWAKENANLESRLEKELEVILESKSYKRLMAFLENAYQQYAPTLLSGVAKKIASFFPKLDLMEDVSYYFNSLSTRATEFEKVVGEGKIPGNLAWSHMYSYSSDETHELFKRTFPKIFPRIQDLEEAIKKEQSYQYQINTLIWSSNSNHKKALPFLLDHYGWFNVLKLLDENNFSTLIHNSNNGEEWQKLLLEKCPEIFAYQDQEKDFLKMNFTHIKALHTPEFVKKHLQALKTTYDNRTRFPLIFSMIDLLNLKPFKEVLEFDPTILDLKSDHGATLIEVLSVMVDEDSDIYRIFISLIESIKKQQKH